MTENPRIRAAESQDMEGVLGLLNGVFSSQQRSTYRRDQKFWNWKYLENPFGRALLSVAEVNNSIVGVDNLWPWELQSGNSLIRAVQACDSAVHPDYRGKGLFTAMRSHGLERAKQEDIDLVFNYPNTHSLSVNLALGWQHLGKVKWWVKLLQPSDVIAGRLSPEHARPVIIDDKYRIDPPLIQELESGSRAESSLIRINRKAGFHAWRYEKHPSRSYGMVRVEHGSNSALAIFTISQKGRTREMVVVDLLGSPGLTLEVIRKALESARQMGVGYVALMDNPEFETGKLWRAGFLSRKLKNMVVLALNKELGENVNHFSNWSLVAGMHDSI
ncbi:MAG: GNAT family N-acetyltransferase [Bacteroidales bacterium]|nr:GNAT family N-acetyltransferase [Bacteroidales bacterium]